MNYYSERWGKTEICKCHKTGEPIYFGDFVKGITKNDMPFEGQMNEIGGGSLGVWVEIDGKQKAYGLHGGVKIKTIELVRRCAEHEKDIHPHNEVIIHVTAKPL